MAEKGQFIQGMLLPDDFDVEKCKKEILEQGRKAIVAMLAHEKETGKKKLFPGEEGGILARFGLKRLRLNGGFHRSVVQLRNPERKREDINVCLILPDFDHKTIDRHDPDVDKHARRWADVLREKHQLTGKEVTKIYTFIQLRRELLDGKDKYDFVNSYDVIMVQRQLHDSVTKFLGQPCFKIKKYPYRIDTEAPRFREYIMNAHAVANLICEANQVHCQIRFGNTTQSEAELCENFEDTLNKAATFLPGGLFNVQVIRMQTECGPALPIYVDFGSCNDVICEDLEPKAEPIVDECSTLPEGLKVKVMPSGKVHVIAEN